MNDNGAGKSACLFSGTNDKQFKNKIDTFKLVFRDFISVLQTDPNGRLYTALYILACPVIMIVDLFKRFRDKLKESDSKSYELGLTCKDDSNSVKL